MAAAAIDIPLIATQYGIPDTTLTTLTESPTPELVSELFGALTARAHELTELKSDKLRLEVELENAVRSSRSKVNVLKSTVEKHLAEVASLRGKLQKAETARSALQSELDAIKSSASTSLSELSSFKARIESLETSNRDTLRLLEHKSTAYDKLADDLTAEHEKVINLRREVSVLEQKLQTSESTASSTRFREQNLQHELELAKKNNEWFETELKTKSAEYLKYRKDKSTRIADLQRQVDDAASRTEQLQRSETAIKAQAASLEQKYEDSLAKIQQLQEEAVQASEQASIEIESCKRLAELQGASAETAKKRVQQLQLDFGRFKDEAAAEVARLRAEVETEHNDKEKAERRVAEMEVQMRDLQAEVVSAQRPSTPMQAMSPLRSATPSNNSFSPKSSRGKASLTLTQMYSEYDKIKTLLAAEQRNNQELKATLDEMVQDLEQSKPEIDELRTDHARLEETVIKMSNILDEAGKERDEATREARRWQGQVEGLEQQRDILRQELKDLSCQIKVLVMEVHLLGSGEQDYDRAELEAIAQQKLEENMKDLNTTGRFITRHLTTFRNLNELQEQNVTLRRMLREIGDKMESEEAREKNAAYQREQEELKELRVRVQNFKQEMANLIAQTNSYIKERDTFRSMLIRRKETGESRTPFSQSMPPGTAPPVTQSDDLSASVAEAPNYADLLRKVQAHFDSFRQETITDQTALKQQLNDMTRRNSELQSEVTRATSQLAGAVQRAELLQSNFDLLKSENRELRSRYENLSETSSKQDLKTQQVAEDLVEAQGMVEGFRREISNLKAEKDLWKSIEKRLTEDNVSLRNDRARLDSLNAQLQSMLSEREHADAESKRRLEASVSSLDAELQATKRKLNKESEETKKAVLRRDFEHEQNQKRIDDLMTSLASTREELAATKTTRDHLQAKVDEMTVELRSAEERLETLGKKQPTAPASQAVELALSDNAEDAGGLSREQELGLQVSELKRDLELTKSELAHANEQVEIYKSISEQSEERLQEFTQTNEQYRADTDHLLEEKNGRITELEKRAEEIAAELAASNAELSRLREAELEAERKYAQQQSDLESEVRRLKAEEERLQAAATCLEQDLKAQADIAQSAQQNYETELVKHAEAAKGLQDARAETNQLKLELLDVKTQAETAKSTLTQQEESWQELKARLEGEIAELGRRREEVLTQNSLLHRQLEGLSKQISTVQKDRAALLDDSDAGTSDSESNLEALQEIIKYLRREKEIVDVQLHLSAQEAKRLRQQLDYTQSQLDETRLKLEQQRRAEADSEHQSLSHNKLVDAINELNLFRESNATLRAQLKTAEASLAEKAVRMEELQQQLGPLEAQIREMEGTIETKEGEMKLLQEDRDHWQHRAQSILHKYDRVDPAEMEALHTKLANLEAEREDITTARNQAQEEVVTLQSKLTEAEQKGAEAEQRLEVLRSKLTEQFKARSKELSGRINAKQIELNQSLHERAAIQQELETVKAELQTVRAEAQAQAQAQAAAAGTTAAPEPIPAAPSAPAAAAEPAGTQSVSAPSSETQTEPSSVSGTDVTENVRLLEQKVQELEAQLAAKDAEVEQQVKERTERVKELYNAKLQEFKAANQEEIQKLISSHNEQLAAAAKATLENLTDVQARELCSKNTTIRTIIRNNIQNALARQRGAAAAKAGPGQASPQVAAQPAQATQNAPPAGSVQPAQQATSAADAAVLKQLEAKFAADKEALVKDREQKVQNAVELAEKKWLAKFSMSETRARNALAKCEVVQKAAAETPQKPVVEVWE
ncbi:hypothetical protein KEM52_002840, partial [Ascosphaera acerosa]